MILLLIFIVLVLVVAASCVKIVPQAHAVILERWVLTNLLGE